MAYIFNKNRLSVYTVSDLVGLYPRDYDVYHEPVFVKDISHESEHTEIAVLAPIPFNSVIFIILTQQIQYNNKPAVHQTEVQHLHQGTSLQS